MERRFVTAEDGTKIGYDLIGRGKTPIVLSNGLGCNEVFFRYLFNDLYDDYLMIHWHLRGHMRSEVPADLTHLDWPYLVDDLKLVLDDAGIEKAVLIGLSLGVEINFELYRKYPERVRAIISVCGNFEYSMHSFLDSTLIEKTFPLVRLLTKAAPGLTGKFWSALVESPLAFPVAKKLIVNPDRIKEQDFFDYLPHIANLDLPCFVEMAHYYAQHSARDLLPKIDVPTLIVGATEDNFTPVRFSLEMADIIPGAKLEIIQGGTHASLIEFPEKINPIIADFLKKLERDEKAKKQPPRKTKAKKAAKHARQPSKKKAGEGLPLA